LIFAFVSVRRGPEGKVKCGPAQHPRPAKVWEKALSWETGWEKKRGCRQIQTELERGGPSLRDIIMKEGWVSRLGFAGAGKRGGGGGRKFAGGEKK